MALEERCLLDAFNEFALAGNSDPEGITAGPDGNLWFTEFTGNRIGRITPAGTVTEFPVLTGKRGPEGITAGPVHFQKGPPL
jgi:virginiamycin B lyase